MLPETIRKRTDLMEPDPILVTRLIKRIEIHSSARDSNRLNRVPINICFAVVEIIGIRTEQETLILLEEMRKSLLKTA